MKQSSLFSRIKKEGPQKAEAISHQYLLRGDFIDQLGAGLYTFLPLGWRVLKKIEGIIRKAMNQLGGQEIFMPSLIPKKFWLEAGRWDKIDPPLFKLKDRHQKEYGLGSTHEEVITDLIRKRIKSYQDLPIYLYQIQNKFRNEMRATSGLLRVKEFLMKDLYSFNSSEKQALAFYQRVKEAYFNIFQQCGLETVAVEASSGTIGGSLCHEFMVLAEVGEDKLILCPSCHFGANLEKTGRIEQCPQCAKRSLEEQKGIEVGHIFYLGTKYSQEMKACFVDHQGKEHPIFMGCYGIGLGRLMAGIVETAHDQKGIIWPEKVAPFDIHLLSLAGPDQAVKKRAEQLYQELTDSGREILYDDREQKSPGEKFAEADIIGIPLRMVVSARTLAEEAVEIKKRAEEETAMVKLSALDQWLKESFKSEK